ncbi:hypothetical protein GCM10010170_062780 [Dactylosporangium salmoneum]|uniref:Uncharacterized protein n=1 Tax=Dactylosporangium salmoneum TaxID=53361 RepID=A0ABP5TYA7_9ACTN
MGDFARSPDPPRAGLAEMRTAVNVADAKWDWKMRHKFVIFSGSGSGVRRVRPSRVGYLFVIDLESLGAECRFFRELQISGSKAEKPAAGFTVTLQLQRVSCREPGAERQRGVNESSVPRKAIRVMEGVRFGRGEPRHTAVTHGGGLTCKPKLRSGRSR